jgi:hypothetical protein
MAGDGWSDLRSGEKKLPASEAGSRHARDAAWDRGRSHKREASTGFLWTTEYGFHRASESDRASWRGSAGASHLGDGAAVPTPARPSGVVARLLSRMSRPHQSLRVALVQPRERGGKRAAQRYRQRTEALAAGRTSRRWTARELLSCPEPSASA